MTMRLGIIAGVLALALGFAAPAHAAGAARAARAAPSGNGPVWVIQLADTINPGSADFTIRGLKQAAGGDACLVVIRLDTPGGVADSMRKMVQAIMESPVPVAVLVAPSGARATSAGAFLVLAGHVAAMAPATHLGAASPVAAGGKEIEGTMAKKAKSDLGALITSIAKERGRDPKLALAMVSEAKSFDAAQAKQAGLIDMIVPDLGSLLTALQGREVQTAAGPRTINTSGKAIHPHEPGLRDKLLSALANPNLAYILLIIGMAGIYFELSHPGTILPGVVGALSLILAFFAMSALPVSYAGLALLGLAAVLFIAEISITSYGLLSVAGAVAMILGSMMLFESDSSFSAISLSVLIPVGGSAVVFFAALAYLAGRAQFRRGSTGQEGLVGQTGVMVDAGKVRVMGELWQAVGGEDLAPGSRVVVEKVDGLMVAVRPAGDKKSKR